MTENEPQGTPSSHCTDEVQEMRALQVERMSVGRSPRKTFASRRTRRFAAVVSMVQRCRQIESILYS